MHHLVHLTTFYIVRHGETDWNVQGRSQGHADIPLNENGEKQARETGKRLQDTHFDEVFSSDLVRAQRTAELITLERNLAITTTQILREKSYGEFEGKLWKEISHLYDQWKELTEKEKWHFSAGVGDETNYEAVTRFITFLRETAITHPSKTILIVCHSGLIRMLLIKLGYGDFDTVGGIENGGHVTVESDGIDFFITDVQGLKPWKE